MFNLSSDNMNLTPNLHTEIDLYGSFTDIRECVCLQVGDINPSILEYLYQNGYSQAPVLSKNGKQVLGFIALEEATILLKSGKQLTAKNNSIIQKYVYTETNLDELLSIMSQNKVALVLEGGSHHDQQKLYRVGLMSLADLNRHAFRSLIYRFLAELEAKLAIIVDRHFPDPWTWLETLSEQNQVALIGSWEVSKRKGVDISPVNAANLSQLFNIFAKFEDIRLPLGFSSRRAFEDTVGEIPDLRNRVMHPVRPLILDADDVVKLRKLLQIICDLEYKASQILGRLKVNSHISAEKG